MSLVKFGQWGRQQNGVGVRGQRRRESGRVLLSTTTMDDDHEHDRSPPPPPDHTDGPPPPPPPAASGSPTDFLKGVVGKRVVVRLTSGVDYRGPLFLASFTLHVRDLLITSSRLAAMFQVYSRVWMAI